MQFRLHINDTNDGTKIAQELRRLATIIDGSPLNDGFTRSLDTGYATMTIEPVLYPDCANAERTLGLTLDWHEETTRFVGKAFGRPIAYVAR